jgi:hypothetical protein
MPHMWTGKADHLERQVGVLYKRQRVFPRLRKRVSFYILSHLSSVNMGSVLGVTRSTRLDAIYKAEEGENLAALCRAGFIFLDLPNLVQIAILEASLRTWNIDFEYLRFSLTGISTHVTTPTRRLPGLESI